VKAFLDDKEINVSPITRVLVMRGQFPTCFFADQAANLRRLASVSCGPTPSCLTPCATRSKRLITGGENPSAITARKITESILTTLKILPKQE